MASISHQGYAASYSPVPSVNRLVFAHHMGAEARDIDPGSGNGTRPSAPFFTQLTLLIWNPD